MHPSQGSFNLVECDVALKKIGIEALLRKFAATEGAGEKSSLVFDKFGNDDVSPG